MRDCVGPRPILTANSRGSIGCIESFQVVTIVLAKIRLEKWRNWDVRWHGDLLLRVLQRI